MSSYEEIMRKGRELRRLKENVDRGIELLDDHYPNWWKKIELSELNMAHCSTCILGQVFEIEEPESYRSSERYRQVFWELIRPQGSSEIDEEDDIEDFYFGFDLYPLWNFVGYLDLAQEWVNRISEKRKEESST